MMRIFFLNDENYNADEVEVTMPTFNSIPLAPIYTPLTVRTSHLAYQSQKAPLAVCMKDTRKAFPCNCSHHKIFIQRAEMNILNV